MIRTIGESRGGWSLFKPAQMHLLLNGPWDFRPTEAFLYQIRTNKTRDLPNAELVIELTSRSKRQSQGSDIKGPVRQRLGLADLIRVNSDSTSMQSMPPEEEFRPRRMLSLASTNRQQVDSGVDGNEGFCVRPDETLACRRPLTRSKWWLNRNPANSASPKRAVPILGPAYWFLESRCGTQVHE
jgi:hypothetical protein